MKSNTGSLAVKLGIVIPLVIIAFAGIWFLTMNISYDNKHARLVADIEDQERKIESNFDKMSKIILQQAEISAKYAKDFKDIYKGMITSRYGEEGSKAGWQWIKEHNPNMSPELYKKLMQTIETQRTGFDREQGKLSQLAAADKKLFTVWPGSWFTSGTPREVTIVSSTKTKAVIESGIDDDVTLFKEDG